MFALGVDGAERAQLGHELAEFAGIHGLTHRGDFGESHFGAGIDHARIDAQSLAFDDARAFCRDDFGADFGDPAVLQDDRNALHFRAAHRVYVDVANDDGVGG